MINCLIIDDEEAGRFFVRQKLNSFYPEIMHIYSANSLSEAQTVLKKIPIDLVFLDIQLKGVSGFELLARNPDRNFEVIFVTAYDEFALRAIQESASYYIMKPIQNEEFKKGVDKAISNIREKRKTEQNVLYINSDSAIEAIPFHEIYFIKSSGSYSLFQLKDRSILSTKNLGFYEQLLPDTFFIRSHHSYIVNAQKIKQIIRGRSGEILLKNDIRIPISQRKLANVMNKLYLK